MNQLIYPLPRATRETEILDGDGGSTYGPFGFKIFDVVDVVAFIRPEGAALWGEAEITVEKVSGLEFDDFTVEFAEALPETTQFIVQARRLHERSLSVFRGGTLSANQLEKELSKQGSVIEEQRRDINRGGSCVPGEEGQTLVFDENGNVKPGADQAEIINAQGYAEEAKEEAGRAKEEADRAGGYASGLNLPAIQPGDAGKQLYVTEEEDGYRLDDPSSGGSVVADRDEMRALSPVDGDVVYLAEPGREGQFKVVDYADHSEIIDDDEFEAVFVRSTANPDKAWMRDEQWRVTGIPARFFGFVSDENNPIEASTTVDGTPKTINLGPFQRAFDFCADHGFLFVIDRRYWIYDYFMNKTGGRIAFIGDGKLIAAESEPTIGGFFTSRYGPTVSDSSPIDVLEVWDLNIDCNLKDAMNGIGITKLTHARFHGVTRVRGTRHHPTFLGGRAVIFEGGNCFDIHVDELYIEDCSIGINSQALPAPSASEAKHISYGRVVMRQVGMPFNVDCTTSGSQDLTVRRMSNYVASAILYNCGRPEWLNSPDRYKGGIITGDRGSGLLIDSLRVVNDDTYGLVGGLFKGTMYGVRVNHADLYGTFNRLADFNNLDFISSASIGSHPSSAEANVTYRGNSIAAIPTLLDTKSGGGALGAVRLTVAAKASDINSIVSVNAGAYDSAEVGLIDLTSNAVIPHRSARQWAAWGNNIAFARGSQKASRIRTDTADATARDFFIVPLPPHGRATAVVRASAFAPQSGANSGVVSQQFHVALGRTGGGTLSSNVQALTAAAALTGYSSATMACTVASVDANNAVIRLSQTNNLSAAMAIHAEADIVVAIADSPIALSDSKVR